MLNKNSARKLGIVAVVLSMLSCGKLNEKMSFKNVCEDYGMHPASAPSMILPEMVDSNSVHLSDLRGKLQDLNRDGKFEAYLSETRHDSTFTYRVQRDEKGKLTLVPLSIQTSYTVGK